MVLSAADNFAVILVHYMPNFHKVRETLKFLKSLTLHLLPSYERDPIFKESPLTENWGKVGEITAVKPGAV
jgi:hypothetical protein